MLATFCVALKLSILESDWYLWGTASHWCSAFFFKGFSGLEAGKLCGFRAIMSTILELKFTESQVVFFL